MEHICSRNSNSGLVGFLLWGKGLPSQKEEIVNEEGERRGEENRKGGARKGEKRREWYAIPPLNYGIVGRIIEKNYHILKHV